MKELDTKLDSVLNAAIDELSNRGTPIFTFAFYCDHESLAVSVCVDTEENSLKQVRDSNGYTREYFLSAVKDRDWDTARIWQANIGRNLSLGDFEIVNLARQSVVTIDDEEFFPAMVDCVIRHEERVASLVVDPQRLVFCCSGPDSEVDLVWSAMTE